MLKVSETGTYAIELRSFDFDAYLVIQDADGVPLAEDDDGLIPTHARLVVELEANAKYQLEVCALHGCFEPSYLPSLIGSVAFNKSVAGISEQKNAVGMLPGLLSGLVFAGVNAAPEENRDDGYLSAEEIQYLDLSTCELAVLSACETALGCERAGEGLMSLRRAFEVAGAHTVISSLWKVDDRATAQLMKWFYENYWQKGMGRNEALHHAKLKMLKQNKADFQGDARPSTWGAFVLSGNWN